MNVLEILSRVSSGKRPPLTPEEERLVMSLIVNEKEQHLLDHGWELSWGMWRKATLLYSQEEVDAMTLDQVKLLVTPAERIS